MSAPPPPPRRRAPVDVASAAPPLPPVNPTSRVARRAGERRGTSKTRRGPILLILSVVVAAALIGVGVLIALDSEEKDKPEVDRSTTVELTVNPAGLDSANSYLTVADFPSDAQDDLRAALEQYVDGVTIEPARKGSTVKDTDLATIFDQGAVARLATTDRDIVLDEGLPKAKGRVVVSAPPIDLYALAEADGKILLITAVLDLGIEIQVAGGTVTVSRAGTLVFAPQSDGSWKITGWTLHVERGGPGFEPVPTTAPTSTTVAG